MAMQRRGKHIVLALVIGLLFAPRAHAYENSVYIWHRDWNEFVRQGILEIQPDVSRFNILCGDFRYENGRSNIRVVDIDWGYFEKINTEVTLAFRINTGTKELFRTGAADGVANSIKRIFDEAVSSSRQYGIKIAGIQFDYDCPTSKLKDYRAFLIACKNYFPGIEISITALPTWLNSQEFKELIAHTSYYILQLHSFEAPKTIGQAQEIFLKEDAPLYIKKASRLRHPYYISLPTYGYEAAFSKDGKFLGLRAEVEPLYLGKDVEYRVIITDPKEISEFFKYIQQVRPKGLLGVSWFRMPLKTDEFNWDIDTFKAIIKNREPRISFRAELTSPQEGLYELYLVNDGEQTVLDPVSIKATWPGGSSIFYDVLGRYRKKAIPDENGIEITGLPPKVGNKTLVAWFRNTNPDDKDISIKVSEVKVNETAK